MLDQIYNAFLIALEVLVLIVRCIFSIFEGIYRLSFPVTEKSVKGDVVLITGAGHGIGRELALQYADLEAIIVCVDINSQTNKSTVAEIKKRGRAAFAYQCDVTKRAEVFQVIEKIQKEVGNVTILVNNAGIMVCRTLLDHTPEEIQKTMDINVNAHFWILQAVLPTMISSNRGHVVALSSSVALGGARNLVPYSASKFAVRGMMESLTNEMSKIPDNKIKFTTLLPCIVDTGLCKNYSMRFPSTTGAITPQEAAAAIITAQRRDIQECTIPTQNLVSFNITRLLGRKVENLIVDFVEVCIDPEIEK